VQEQEQPPQQQQQQHGEGWVLQQRVLQPGRSQMHGRAWVLQAPAEHGSCAWDRPRPHRHPPRCLQSPRLLVLLLVLALVLRLLMTRHAERCGHERAQQRVLVPAPVRQARELAMRHASAYTALDPI
jgi:hypothetical protein